MELEKHRIGGSSFQFSGAKILSLKATEYTIVAIVVDCSGSISGYEKQINDAIKFAIEDCRRSPRADNLMIRVVTFDHKVVEHHGFRPLMDLNPDDYNSVCHAGGSTALYDATYNAIMSLAQYGKSMVDNQYDVNAACFVITDGADNASTTSRGMVKQAMEDAKKGENLESIMPVLIGVGTGAEDESNLSGYLSSFRTEAGFQQYIWVDALGKGKLAKLGGFISKSISSQSQALGTGGPSQSLTI